jgi:hypothetical protein
MEGRLQNEKVVSWTNPFGVGIFSAYSNDGKGGCRHQHFSAAHHFFRTTGVDRASRDVCICRS